MAQKIGFAVLLLWRGTLTGAWVWVYTKEVKIALLECSGGCRAARCENKRAMQARSGWRQAGDMKQNTSKLGKERRAARRGPGRGSHGHGACGCCGRRGHYGPAGSPAGGPDRGAPPPSSGRTTPPRPAPIRTRKNRSRKSPRSRRRAKLQRSSPQSPKPRARQLLWKKKLDPQRPA